MPRTTYLITPEQEAEFLADIASSEKLRIVQEREYGGKIEYTVEFPDTKFIPADAELADEQMARDVAYFESLTAWSCVFKNFCTVVIADSNAAARDVAEHLYPEHGRVKRAFRHRDQNAAWLHTSTY